MAENSIKDSEYHQTLRIDLHLVYNSTCVICYYKHIAHGESSLRWQNLQIPCREFLKLYGYNLLSFNRLHVGLKSFVGLKICVNCSFEW